MQQDCLHFNNSTFLFVIKPFSTIFFFSVAETKNSFKENKKTIPSRKNVYSADASAFFSIENSKTKCVFNVHVFIENFRGYTLGSRTLQEMLM